MGIKNPIKIPLHKKKSGDKVADNPPPVFNKHGQGEEFLKGHKGNQKLTPSPSNSKDALNGSNHSVGEKSGHSTSSTALWIAASNAQAHDTKTPPRRSSDGGANNNHMARQVSDDTYDDEDEEEYYEEEIIEEFIEEEVLDELPPRRITIRFDEFDEMQTILHINDYTKHEISRSWYKRDDYDKMVALARKTAEKVEERTRELGRKIDKKHSKKIEYRGLEAWTSMGAAKVKILKESAVEAVWNEQSRQWDLGTNDINRIRELYQIVSKGAQQIANDRGFSDELIAKRIRQIEAQELEKKQNRKLLGKSKALLGKSVKVTAGGVVKTAKLGVKTTKLTGKVAMRTGRAATKTAVATATFDRKMFKEAIIPAKKKRECEKQTIRVASQAQSPDELQEDGRPIRCGTYLYDFKRFFSVPCLLTISFCPPVTEHSTPESQPQDDDDDSAASESGKSKKKSKLKLLGVVPIPGTHKTYREDRRQNRIEKRMEKQKTRPSWEKNVSAGKY